MDKIFEQTLLFDFYGELLNDHQKNVYQSAVFDDLSLSELADEYGISRQAAHDLIKRVNKTLESYESRLHMIARFKETDRLADNIKKLAIEVINEQDLLESSRKKLEEIKKDAQGITEVMNNT